MSEIVLYPRSGPWTRLRRGAAVAAALLAFLPVAASAQVLAGMTQISPEMGEMTATLETAEGGRTVEDTLRFEPFQLIEEMFLRNDVVWVMRHGPTDWSKLDIKDAGPTACADQRILSPEGRTDMVNMGILLAENEVLPGRIVASEWCRNQQTVAALLEGAGMVEPEYPEQVPVETSGDLNLLLALQGAPDVVNLRELVSSWSGEGFERPLLVVTHFTNIEELFNFSVYEGEILVVDPKRDNRVLGYLRLRSAAPDVGHFNLED